jgi:hypothetical protein
MGKMRHQTLGPARGFKNTQSSAIMDAVPISLWKAARFAFGRLTTFAECFFALATETRHDKHALSRRQSRISGRV